MMNKCSTTLLAHSIYCSRPEKMNSAGINLLYFGSDHWLGPENIIDSWVVVQIQGVVGGSRGKFWGLKSPTTCLYSKVFLSRCFSKQLFNYAVCSDQSWELFGYHLRKIWWISLSHQVVKECFIWLFECIILILELSNIPLRQKTNSCFLLPARKKIGYVGKMFIFQKYLQWVDGETI